MATSMAQVQARTEQARATRDEAQERQQAERTAAAERAAAEADRRAAAAAEAKTAKAARAQERRQAKAERSTQTPYQPGDGRTHATGLERLGVVADGGCVCGCGGTPTKRRSRFVPGHDARMYRLAKAYRGVLGSEELQAARESITDRQRSYLQGRGLI